MSTQPINPFKPLQELCNNCINTASLQKAFEDTFRLICEKILQLNNPNQSKEWLESKDPWAKIEDLNLELKGNYSGTQLVSINKPLPI
jgi:hypothetical protein